MRSYDVSSSPVQANISACSTLGLSTVGVNDSWSSSSRARCRLTSSMPSPRRKKASPAPRVPGSAGPGHRVVSASRHRLFGAQPSRVGSPVLYRTWAKVVSMRIRKCAIGLVLGRARAEATQTPRGSPSSVKRTIANECNASARSGPGCILAIARSSSARARPGSPPSKQCPANRTRRSGVSPPRAMASSSSSAAAAGAPRACAEAAASSSASRVSGSPAVEANARCRARSSNSSTTPARRRCISLRCVGEASVYTPLAQQWMGESDPVAFDEDDAVALSGLEELDQPVMVDGGRFTDELDRRRGQAGGGKQYVMYRGIEAADPGPDQLSQCRRAVSHRRYRRSARANSMA